MKFGILLNFKNDETTMKSQWDRIFVTQFGSSIELGASCGTVDVLLVLSKGLGHLK